MRLFGALHQIKSVRCYRRCYSRIGYQPFFTQSGVISSGLQDFRNDRFQSPKVDVGVWQIPHPEKAAKGGEDTYFLAPKPNGSICLGVFDGVGGWSDHGINPRDYSYNLALTCKEKSEKYSDPLRILQEGYDVINEKGVIGTCTACVVCVDGTDLRAINLGDSGCLVIRDGKAHFRTKEQQHLFNMPYQLGYESTDRPADGAQHDLVLYQGDIVVLVTDGVLDNIFPEQIAEIADKNVKESAQHIAMQIAQKSSIVGATPHGLTPWAKNAKKFGYLDEDGGKEDDVTVMVVKILAEE